MAAIYPLKFLRLCSMLIFYRKKDRLKIVGLLGDRRDVINNFHRALLF
jgi:hypothetical protein